MAAALIVLLNGCAAGTPSRLYSGHIAGRCGRHVTVVGGEVDLTVMVSNRTSRAWRQTWVSLDASDFSVGRIVSTLHAARDSGSHVYALGRLGVGGHFKLTVPLLARHVAFSKVDASAWGSSSAAGEPTFPDTVNTITCRYTIR